MAQPSEMMDECNFFAEIKDHPFQLNRKHMPGQIYSYRLPTPPRIIVPPPTTTIETPTLSIGQSASTTEEEVDTSFLQEYNLDSIVQKNTLLEWSYVRRRQAQMILPWLWLGPMAAAKDEEFLRREGITMSLAVRTVSNSLTGGLKMAQKLGLEVAAVDAADYFALIRMFAPSVIAINRHISRVRQISTAQGNPQLGKVLVFCESGNEKAAAVVAAYLMEIMNDFDHVKAMQVCQAQRFCVNFDDTLKNLLRAHWDLVRARRTVAKNQSTLLDSTAVSNSLHRVQEHLKVVDTVQKQKRSLDETVENEDFNMDEGVEPSDVLRFAGRDNTPFQDT